MDEEIEKREGMSIPAIFSEHGEAYFRQLETDLLKETSALGGFLVSCGGGAAMREENVREMKKSGIIVLLTALPETILERVADDENRPLLKGLKNADLPMKQPLITRWQRIRKHPHRLQGRFWKFWKKKV